MGDIACPLEDSGYHCEFLILARRKLVRELLKSCKEFVKV